MFLIIWPLCYNNTKNCKKNVAIVKLSRDIDRPKLQKFSHACMKFKTLIYNLAIKELFITLLCHCS